MNITYLRRMYRPDGIFSLASRDDTGAQIAVILEHAYWDDTQQKFLPILQPGIYDCVRGAHRLDGMAQDFITFEITGVVDQNGKAHSGVLFHWGNWNVDSKGCSLMGQGFATGVDPRDHDPRDNVSPPEMITHSKTTFDNFMLLQTGVDRFKLTVKG
jgi:hypothetical protein